jgi:hypothetical protein
MNSFLRIENRRTGETLRMRRERSASGQIILIVEGSLPAGSAGPPLSLTIGPGGGLIRPNAG